MGRWHSNLSGLAARQAWKDGYNAFHDGRGKEWCPIARTLDTRRDWIAGWNYAESQSKKKQTSEAK